MRLDGLVIVRARGLMYKNRDLSGMVFESATCAGGHLVCIVCVFEDAQGMQSVEYEHVFLEHLDSGPFVALDLHVLSLTGFEGHRFAHTRMRLCRQDRWQRVEYGLMFALYSASAFLHLVQASENRLQTQRLLQFGCCLCHSVLYRLVGADTFEQTRHALGALSQPLLEKAFI